MTGKPEVMPPGWQVTPEKRPCGKLNRIDPIHNFPVSTSSQNASIAAAHLIAERKRGLQSERLSVHFRVRINEIVQRIAVLPRVQAYGYLRSFVLDLCAYAVNSMLVGYFSYAFR